MPVALLLGIGRETTGATYSIDREPNIAIIAERFGNEAAELRGTMAVYICATLPIVFWVSTVAILSTAPISPAGQVMLKVESVI